jgi:ketosteroid isomerase-like protein
MPKLSKAELLRRYYGAYQSKDRKVIEDALTDDFTFTSPYDDAIDRAAYFERCWPGSELMHEIVLEKVFEEGEEAFARYQVQMKDGRNFRNTEFITFRGRQIASVEVYFGATYKAGRFIAKKPE